MTAEALTLRQMLLHGGLLRLPPLRQLATALKRISGCGANRHTEIPWNLQGISESIVFCLYCHLDSIAEKQRLNLHYFTETRERLSLRVDRCCQFV